MEDIGVTVFQEIEIIMAIGIVVMIICAAVLSGKLNSLRESFESFARKSGSSTGGDTKCPNCQFAFDTDATERHRGYCFCPSCRQRVFIEDQTHAPDPEKI